jgi:hypothetical protein
VPRAPNLSVVFYFRLPLESIKELGSTSGDMAMVEKYYQTWGQLDFLYVLLTSSQTTYIHGCHVKGIKSPMLLADHKVQSNDLVCNLDVHAKDNIRHATTTIELL